MEKYLKMSGHFVGNVSINTDGQICDDKYFRGSTDIAEDYYDPICHAINSHDELVVEVERLTASLNHANSNHELFERQYYLEKDKCEDLQAEVERLRDMVIRMQTYLDMAGEYPEKESDNPVRQWLFDAIDCTK